MKRAIVNCHMVDVNKGDFQENITILWQNNTIIELGKQLNLPADTEVIDGSGCFVTPGLIHSFTNIGLKEYGIRWEGEDSYEASSPVQPHLSVVDGINPYDKAFEVARAYGVTTAHVSPGPENVISGKTAIIQTAGSVVDDMVMKADHGLAVSLGEVPKSAYRQKFKTPLTRMRIAYMIREQLRKAMYDDKSEVYKENIFQRILEKEASLYIRAHRADDIATAVRLKKEFDIHVVLVHATEAYHVTDILAGSGTPVLAGPFYSPKSRDELKNLHPSTSININESGVAFSLISNAARNLTLEGALSVREGIPVNKALKALTIDAAKILGVSDQVGSIEAGKQADFVLWDNKPLEFKTNVVQTIIKGASVYKREGASK
jgi:imidazolonepropionase-like amidohydrolase